MRDQISIIDPPAAMPAAVIPMPATIEVRAAHNDCGSRRDNNRCRPALPSSRTTPAVAAAPAIAADIPARALPAARIPAVPAAGINVLHAVDDRHRLLSRANRAWSGRQWRRLRAASRKADQGAAG